MWAGTQLYSSHHLLYKPPFSQSTPSKRITTTFLLLLRQSQLKDHWSFFSTTMPSSNMKPRRSLCCELCNEQPTVYCESDSAFLCSTCDTQVHRANFVAARHLRIPIQSYGLGDDDAADSSSCSSSSSSSTESCVSSSESAATDRARKVRGQVGRRAKLGLEARAEVVVVDWCRRVLGGGAKEEETGGCVVEVAMRAVRAGLRKMKRIPMRCLVAAAVWTAVETSHGGGRRRNTGGGRLRGVEECSGVPAQVILVVEGLTGSGRAVASSLLQAISIMKADWDLSQPSPLSSTRPTTSLGGVESLSGDVALDLPMPGPTSPLGHLTDPA